jgi:hypothetical protein
MFATEAQHELAHYMVLSHLSSPVAPESTELRRNRKYEKLNMTRDDLKSCSGYTVQVIMDGKEELGDLDAENPEKAFLTVAKTGVFPEEVRPYYLSDEGHRRFIAKRTS